MPLILPAHKPKPDTTLRCIYTNETRHEILLLDLWRQITTADDMPHTLGASLHSPLAFCAHFARPDLLRFCIDEVGIWFAFWTEPVLLGALQGLWIRPTYRKSRISVDAVLRAITWAFSLYPVLLSTTVQEKVVRQLLTLGYSTPHFIPELWASSQCFTYHTGPGAMLQYQTRASWLVTQQRLNARGTTRGGSPWAAAAKV